MKLKKYKCTSEIVDVDSVADYFKSKLALYGQTNVPESYGNTRSTVGDYGLILPFNIFFPNLYKWIHSCAKSFCVDNNHEFKTLSVVRFWINEMFNGSEAKVHIHSNPQVVCVIIFYLYAEKTSGNLLILNEYDGSTQNLSLIEKIPEKHKQYIPVETGDLIIHDPMIAHAVTTWKGDKPRLSLIMEFKTSNN